MRTDTIAVHVIPLTEPGNPEFLTPDEMRRAAAFRFESHRSRWIASRSALRRILGEALDLPPLEVPMIISSFGKPYLNHPYADFHFNLSHCDSLALLAIQKNAPLGIDVEPAGRAHTLTECASSFLHPHELQRASTPHDLLEIWCAKEALLKAHGTGLLIDPVSLCLSANLSAIEAPADFPPFRIIRLSHLLPASHTAFVATPLSGNSVTLTAGKTSVTTFR